MRRIIATRAAWTFLVLLGVSFVSFMLLELAPGRVYDSARLDPGSSPATIAKLEARYGLDQPWYVQYGYWLAGVARMDLGYSIRYDRSVAELVRERLPPTLALALLAHATSLLLALALGLLMAERRGGAADRASRVVAVGMLSVHPVVLALLAMLFAAGTGWLPIGGGSTPSLFLTDPSWLGRARDRAQYLVLPGLVLTLVMLPPLTLQARAAFVEAFGSPAVRAARARGVTERQLLLRHVAPLALLPVFSFWGASFGRLLSAAFLVEVVTAWPGLGPLTLEAVRARDPFLLLGTLFVAAVLLSLFHLVNDLMLVGADPRLRLEEA